jgi:hypothetical protein
MKTFLERWKAWAGALRYARLIAKSARIRCELVLELKLDVDDADRGDLAMLRSGLPGWRIDWCGDDRVRCVPPAIGVER